MAGARHAWSLGSGCTQHFSQYGIGRRHHARAANRGAAAVARTVQRDRVMNGIGARQDAMTSFLRDAGWGAAARRPLPGDASTRHYVRLHLGERTAMLMDQPQGAEAPLAAPGASPEERRAFGYNALARLAGADCARFVAAARYLRGRGLAAPDVYAADMAHGFLLLED